jgi:hypothetical protein
MKNNIDLRRVYDVAIDAKPDIREYLNCGYINREIQNTLNEKTKYGWEFVEGSIAPNRVDYEEHGYVRLPASNGKVPDEIIVDGAIKQFCEENSGKIWVTLDERRKLPEVAITTKNKQLMQKLNEYTGNTGQSGLHKIFSTHIR